MLRKAGIGFTLIVLAIMFFAIAALIHPFGEPPAAMDDYILENTQQQTGANNAVSAVVFDWRGYDTLGEATVLFTTFTAIVMLLRKRKDEESA